MKDEAQAEHAAILRLEEAIEFMFHLHGISLRREPKATSKSPDVGVHGKSWKVECHRTKHVASFSPDAGERHQLRKLRRDLPAVAISHGPSHADQIGCLGSIEAR